MSALRSPRSTGKVRPARLTDLAALGELSRLCQSDSADTRSLGAEISTRYESRAELNSYPNGLPDSMQQQLTQRYADLFSVFLKHRDSISRVMLWGVTDGNSWLNS